MHRDAGNRIIWSIHEIHSPYRLGFSFGTFVHAAERIGNPKVKVAAIQCSSDLGAVARNRGKLVAHYRKLTPWPVPEKSWATAGDRGIAVYDTEFGRVGLAICFDIHSILEKYEPKDIWA